MNDLNYCPHCGHELNQYRLNAAMSKMPDDDLYWEVEKFIIDMQAASVAFLQRRFQIGYARASRLIDMLEERGVVGPSDGVLPREVLRQPRSSTEQDTTDKDDDEGESKNKSE